MLGEWKLSLRLIFLNLFPNQTFAWSRLLSSREFVCKIPFPQLKCKWNNFKLFKFIFKADKFQKLCFSLDFVLEIVNLLLFKPNEANSKFVFLQTPFVNMIFVGFEALIYLINVLHSLVFLVIGLAIATIWGKISWSLRESSLH